MTGSLLLLPVRFAMPQARSTPTYVLPYLSRPSWVQTSLPIPDLVQVSPSVPYACRFCTTPSSLSWVARVNTRWCCCGSCSGNASEAAVKILELPRSTPKRLSAALENLVTREVWEPCHGSWPTASHTCTARLVLASLSWFETDKLRLAQSLNPSTTTTTNGTTSTTTATISQGVYTSTVSRSLML